jgi:hypothetical protein
MAPLTSACLPKLPLVVRCIGWLNDRSNTRFVNSVLALRNHRDVMNCWMSLSPSRYRVRDFLQILSREIGWKDPNFTPKDTCFVSFKLWWHGIADCFERESCLLALQRAFRVTLSSSTISRLDEMTLGELFTCLTDGTEEVRGEE